MKQDRTAIAVLGAKGRIGSLVAGMDDARWQVLPITRKDDPAGLTKPGPALPILVCTRNDDLPAVLEQVHPSRHKDLVFVQNGMILPWLEERGLARCTRGVLWVAVAKVGDPPIPGGTSPFSGPHARVVADLLQSHGVDAAAVDEQTLRTEVAIKLAWICITGVLGSATKKRVGEIAREHEADVRALAREMLPLLRVEPGVDLDLDPLVERIQAYSLRIPHFPASIKEWRWRTGWQLRRSRALGLPTPVLDRWLRACGIDPEEDPGG